ncbi:hypothetical protein CDAR_86311 [Caerostris darwini]|uniref:Uncharacterized protein n=1 Tax=Caerostris darwini TaxID=1538125 RepID=A0AAV4NMG1_9ARAC|nr:hypothetical protein CDAR_86311 [Caerostris darwini]
MALRQTLPHSNFKALCLQTYLGETYLVGYRGNKQIQLCSKHILIDSSSPIPTRGQTTSKHIDETLFSNDMRLQQRSSQTQYNPLCN